MKNQILTGLYDYATRNSGNTDLIPIKEYLSISAPLIDYSNGIWKLMESGIVISQEGNQLKKIFDECKNRNRSHFIITGKIAFFIGYENYKKGILGQRNNYLNDSSYSLDIFPKEIQDLLKTLISEIKKDTNQQIEMLMKVLNLSVSEKMKTEGVFSSLISEELVELVLLGIDTSSK